MPYPAGIEVMKDRLRGFRAREENVCFPLMAKYNEANDKVQALKHGDITTTVANTADMTLAVAQIFAAWKGVETISYSVTADLIPRTITGPLFRHLMEIWNRQTAFLKTWRVITPAISRS
jgi:hypothetical protein